MTTKETADALGVSESTIQRHAKELGLTENGKQTELDERAVTIIKTKIERSGRSDLRNVAELPNINTDLEMMVLSILFVNLNQLFFIFFAATGNGIFRE